MRTPCSTYIDILLPVAGAAEEQAVEGEVSAAEKEVSSPPHAAEVDATPQKEQEEEQGDSIAPATDADKQDEQSKDNGDKPPGEGKLSIR